MTKRPSRAASLQEAADSILAEHNITGAFDPDWLTDQLLIRGVQPSVMGRKAALKKELTTALRGQKFTYKGIYKVRQKISITHKLADGTKMVLWADAHTAHPQFWEQSLTEKWESFANRGFQLHCDLIYYNSEKNPGAQFNLEFDLRDENADREHRSKSESFTFNVGEEDEED